MRRVIFLEKQTDVDLLTYVQEIQTRTKKPVVVKHQTLVQKLGRSESTIRRAIRRLVKSGHLLRTYVNRDRGGRLCAYWVRPDVVYQKASIFQRAKAKIDQLRHQLETAPKPPSEASLKVESGQPSIRLKSNKRNNKRSAHPSIDSKEVDMLPGLLQTAKAIGVDDQQRGFLRLAALRYGVREAWRALQIAYEHGYALADLVRVTWGILKRQYPEGVMT